MLTDQQSCKAGRVVTRTRRGKRGSSPRTSRAAPFGPALSSNR
jgi:hypothetical protein